LALAVYGIGATRGIAIGRVHIAQHHRVDISQQSIEKARIEDEVKRLHKAVRQARKQLQDIRDRLPGSTPAEISEFIDTHVLMLEDGALTDGPAQLIREQRCNAEWALQMHRDRLAAVFEDMEDPYLASRIDDVDHVIARVQNVLTGATSQDLEANDIEDASYEGMVLVVDDLAPAELTLLHHRGMIGLVTEHGGPLSHTAILARSLKIPTALGVRHARQLLIEGERVIIDGERGIVLAKPPRSVQQHYRERLKAADKHQKSLLKIRNKPAITRDGRVVQLQANVDLPRDLELLKDSGADGIGLYRTEYLFMNRTSPPDEEEQFDAYASVVSALPDRPVTLRTLDLGADKQVDGGRARSTVAINPALGLRAIRLCLTEQNLFIPQLRAMLRASRFGRMRILIPMLSNSQELFRVKGLIREIARDLRQSGEKIAKKIELGGMIEVPAAALSARTFAKHLDFLSIGTNDLIQYTLAIDRIDDQVSHLYDPLHPAVLRLLKIIISEAADVGTPVSMCGEMAGDPNFTRLLLGLGLTDFSMHPGSLQDVKHVVRRTKLPALRSVHRRLMRATNPLRISGLLRDLNEI
jgi:phosphotransferase system enzyme I (PtsI)